MKKSIYLFLFFIILPLLVNGEEAKLQKFYSGNEEIYSIYLSDEFIAAGRENSLLLFNKARRLLWNFSTEDEINCISISRDNKNILASSPRHLYFFNSAGDLKWKKEINDSWIGGYPQVISVFSNTIAVGLMNGFLRVYDIEGNEKWKFKTGDAYVIAVKILNDKGIIAISDKQIYLLDKANGNLKLKYSPKESYIRSVFIHDNGLVGISLGNNWVELYRIYEGLKWRYKLDDKIGSIFLSDRLLATGSKDGGLYIFDLERGNLKLKKKLPQGVKQIAISKNNKIFASTLGEELYSSNLNGELEPVYFPKEKISVFSSLDKYVVAGSTAGNLYYLPIRIGRDKLISIFILGTIVFVTILFGIMFFRAVKVK